MGKIPSYDLGTAAAGVRLLGTSQDATNETLNYDIDELDDYYSGKRVNVPASASATGVAGSYATESGFAYFCVATDTWERVAIATW